MKSLVAATALLIMLTYGVSHQPVSASTLDYDRSPTQIAVADNETPGHDSETAFQGLQQTTPNPRISDSVPGPREQEASRGDRVLFHLRI